MQNIKDLFGKIQNILNQKGLEKEVIQSVLEKVIGIKIDSNHIEIKEGVVSIKEKPIIKNEIFNNQEKILEELKKLKSKISEIK